jgi:hypothetical protein
MRPGTVTPSGSARAPLPVDGGSRIGARYRHTTDAMALRVVEAIQERLTIALRVAEDTPASRQATRRVF